jgi:hypothetical protein
VRHVEAIFTSTDNYFCCFGKSITLMWNTYCQRLTNFHDGISRKCVRTIESLSKENHESCEGDEAQCEPISGREANM